MGFCEDKDIAIMNDGFQLPGGKECWLCSGILTWSCQLFLKLLSKSRGLAMASLMFFII